MKHSGKWKLMVAAMAAALVTLAWSQVSTAVKGKVKDEQGVPIVGAIVEYHSQETGRKYTLETNKNGDFYSIGISSGTYKATLYRNKDDHKAGKVLFFFNNIQVTISREINELDFDLAKERAASGTQMNAEAKRQAEEAQKENVKVKGLNEMLAQAALATDAQNFDQAAEILTRATQADPTRDLLWFKLGDAYLGGKKYDLAVDSYQKALAIKPVGAYYNNLGQAQVKSGKVEDAIASYTRAAEMEPANAGQYYFNLGAVLINQGKADEAISAFDRATQADPGKVEAYYQKGMLMAGKSTLKDGKYVPPPGTVETLQKVVELQPDGELAAQAKGMITELGGEVQSSYKKSKTTKKN
ncbi:MAG: tetratricopeptide repeat protein [Terriglobales bacterium]